MNNVVDLMDRRRRAEAVEVQPASPPVLKHGGGGGTSNGMETVDAKIAAAEARTDTKFAELRGDLAKFATKGTVWGAMATALGIVLATASLAGNRFDAGMSVRSSLEAVSAGQKVRDAEQDRKLDEILRRLPAPAKPTPAK